MACACCDIGLDEVFGERRARREARAFRKRGLSDRASALVAGVTRHGGLPGATALEVGAGIGAVAVTLLERGAARATTVDAVPAFGAAARQLAAEHGVAERMDVIVGDFAAHADVAGPADIVVLDRVICCYPSLDAMLIPAADRARRVIGLTYPRDRWWVRAAIRLVNAGQSVLRRRFRLHAHPPADVRRLLGARGLASEVVATSGFWEVLVARRAA